MSNQFKLVEQVLNHSVSEDWDSALEEWMVIGFDYDNTGYSECACGKQHISELNYVRNKYTDVELVVGSECINKFFVNHGVDLNKVHASIKRVYKNRTKSLNIAIIVSANRYGIINYSEFKFYKDIIRKRELTSAQKRWKILINEKIMQKIKKIK